MPNAPAWPCGAPGRVLVLDRGAPVHFPAAATAGAVRWVWLTLGYCSVPGILNLGHMRQAGMQAGALPNCYGNWHSSASCGRAYIYHNV